MLPRSERAATWANVVFVTAVCVVLTAGLVWRSRPSPPSAPVTEATATTVSPSRPAPPAPSVPSPGLGTVPAARVDDDQEAGTDDRREALDTSSRFLVAWLTPGTPEIRLLALQGLTTVQLLPLLADVDPGAIPAASVDSVAIDSINPMEAIVGAVLTDGTQLALRLVKTGAGWQVATLDRPAGPRGKRP